ncbi:MBL fold metallo-hydrolase [Enterococcus sp. LJL128]
MKTIYHSTEESLQLITMPRIFPINCYIILEKDYCVLIDCSKQGMAEPIIKAVEDTGKPLKYIILTHAHADHTGDINKIKNYFPKAKVCIGAQEFSDSKTGVRNIHLPIEPDLLLKHKDVLGSLVVYETPGHTNGSISLIDTRSLSSYVGDLIQTRGGAAISGDLRWRFPFPAFATVDKQAAVDSVKSLYADYTIYKTFCGHGPVLVPTHNEITQLIKRAEQKI